MGFEDDFHMDVHSVQCSAQNVLLIECIPVILIVIPQRMSKGLRSQVGLHEGYLGLLPRPAATRRGRPPAPVGKRKGLV